MNQNYEATLDVSKYLAGQEKMKSSAKMTATNLEAVYAKMNARASKMPGEFMPGASGSAKVFGGGLKAGAAAAKDAADQTEKAGSSTLGAALKFGVLAFAAKKAWQVGKDAMQAYAATSAYAAAEVGSLSGMLGKLQESFGRNLTAGISGLLGGTNGGSLAGLYDSAVKGYTDLFGGAGTYDKVRAQEDAAAKVAAENAAELKSLDVEKQIGQAISGIVDDRDKAAVLAQAEAKAGEQLRERMAAIEKLEGLRAARKVELTALAVKERDAMVADAIRRQREAQNEADDAARFDALQARAEAVRAAGDEGRGEQLARQADLERSLYQIRRSSASEDVKRARVAAEVEKSAAMELKYRTDVNTQAKEEATASFLSAKQASNLTKTGAELAAKQLAAEKQVEDLRRKGASEGQIRMLQLLQGQELSASALSLARDGIKLPDAARLGQGEGSFLGQVAGPSDQFSRLEAKASERAKKYLDEMRQIRAGLDRVVEAVSMAGTAGGTYGP